MHCCIDAVSVNISEGISEVKRVDYGYGNAEWEKGQENPASWSQTLECESQG
jgi:hypothetical protein